MTTRVHRSEERWEKSELPAGNRCRLQQPSHATGVGPRNVIDVAMPVVCMHLSFLRESGRILTHLRVPREGRGEVSRASCAEPHPSDLPTDTPDRDTGGGGLGW